MDLQSGETRIASIALAPGEYRTYTLEARSECVKSMKYALVWRADPLVGWPLQREVYEAIPNVPQKKEYALVFKGLHA